MRRRGTNVRATIVAMLETRPTTMIETSECITLFRIQFTGNCPGMQIKLHGFTLQANLNGCRGRLIRWCGKKTERWEMLLLSHAETTRIHFKSPSMKVVPMDAAHCQRRNCHIHPSIHPYLHTYRYTYIHTYRHTYIYKISHVVSYVVSHMVPCVLPCMVTCKVPYMVPDNTKHMVHYRIYFDRFAVGSFR